MATTVHADETDLAQLLERAAAGEEIIIARGETPVARLVPIALAAPSSAHVPTRTDGHASPRPIRRPGLFAGQIVVGAEFFEPLPEDELRQWEGGDDE